MLIVAGASRGISDLPNPLRRLGGELGFRREYIVGATQ